jgi:hypothetical protein
MSRQDRIAIKAAIIRLSGAILLALLAVSVLALLIWTFGESTAHAAVHPDTEMPSVRPEAAKDAVAKKKATCAKQTVVILYGADEGGKLVPFAYIRGPLESC